jgi:hypothetical protein
MSSVSAVMSFNRREKVNVDFPLSRLESAMLSFIMDMRCKNTEL